MGFLKRIFSFASKKNKKRPLTSQSVDSKLGVSEEEHEEVVGRLLRSSSSCYKVVAEVDYATLPPLPHPINEVIQHPSTSTASLASTATSQRGTYTVTVYGRTRDALAEFPLANRGLDKDNAILHHRYSPSSPKENFQLFGLRSDPSLVSLIEMYDEHGKLASDAFTSSPPPEHQQGRVPTRRTGSTLRQLLGNPTDAESRGDGDGDISWAERFLGENASASSTSSFDLRTPSTPSYEYNDNSHASGKQDSSIFSDQGLSQEMQNNPTISSMEVEVSMTESLLSLEICKNTDATTPKRASQIFEFLTENRRSKYSPDSAQFSLGPEHLNQASDFDIKSCFLDDPVEATPVASAILSHSFEDISPTSLLTGMSNQKVLSSVSGIPRPIAPFPRFYPPPLQDAETINQYMDVESATIAPANLVSSAVTSQYKSETPSRLPRRRKSGSSGDDAWHRPKLIERSNFLTLQPHDLCTSAIPRHKHSRKPSHGHSSNASSSNDVSWPVPIPSGPRRKELRSIFHHHEKEREEDQHQYSIAPPRFRSDSKSLLRAVVQPGLHNFPRDIIPSPASSSELSPVGQQLMSNIRGKKSKARGTDWTTYSGPLTRIGR